MLPLAGADFPSTPEALRASLFSGLERLGFTPRELRVEGAALPRLERIRIDLTGCALGATPPKMKVGAAQSEGLETASFELFGEPLTLAGEAVRLRVEGRGVQLRRHAAEGVDAMLVPEGATDGKVSLELSAAALERIVHLAAREAAKARGAEVPELRLKLSGSGGRTAEVDCEVVGKFGFMKATLRVTGRAELTDDLSLRLSNLDLKGSGMASGLAIGFLRPQLEKLEREPISLAALPLGGLKLRDARLYTGETVRFEAALGS